MKSKGDMSEIYNYSRPQAKIIVPRFRGKIYEPLVIYRRRSCEKTVETVFQVRLLDSSSHG